VVLVPVGAQAAQVVSAIITDPGGANKAAVDAGGNLHVAGQVTVDSSSPVVITSRDDPGRAAFGDLEFLDMDPGTRVANAFVDVPAGQRLVITHVTGDLVLPAVGGQTPVNVVLNFAPPAGSPSVDYHFVPSLIGTDVSGSHFAFSQETLLYVDDEFIISWIRSDTASTATADVSVSGYLIDCTAASCN
jgi:hypothetical protein